jgi:hypothetical protein
MRPPRRSELGSSCRLPYFIVPRSWVRVIRSHEPLNQSGHLAPLEVRDQRSAQRIMLFGIIQCAYDPKREPSNENQYNGQGRVKISQYRAIITLCLVGLALVNRIPDRFSGYCYLRRTSPARLTVPPRLTNSARLTILLLTTNSALRAGPSPEPFIPRHVLCRSGEKIGIQADPVSFYSNA